MPTARDIIHDVPGALKPGAPVINDRLAAADRALRDVKAALGRIVADLPVSDPRATALRRVMAVIG